MEEQREGRERESIQEEGITLMFGDELNGLLGVPWFNGCEGDGLLDDSVVLHQR